MAIATATFNKFSPKPERFGVGSMGLAFLAHGFLIAALTWGTTWRSSNQIVTASAELWAELPTQAAPALVEAPPVAEPVVEKPAEIAPAIVTKKTKVREKLAANKKKEHEAERQQDLNRQDTLKRMMGLAGATGSSNSSGNQPINAGQMADYSAFVRSVIAPNISYQNTDFEKTTLVTEVMFEIASDGSILHPRVSKTSGNKEWDAIAVRAVEKTNIIPRDRKGYRPDSLIAQVKPRGQ